MPEEHALITGSTTLLEAVQLRPGCEEVFRARDVQAGRCLLCNHLFDSVELVAALYALDIEALLRECNETKAPIVQGE